jgi:hypothetical protein
MSHSQSSLVVGLVVLNVMLVPTWYAHAGEAVVNLEQDPWGRVVDVTFDAPLDVSAPWDRYRFSIDRVAPMARDGAAAFGDVNDDGITDLILATFDGHHQLYPGVEAGSGWGWSIPQYCRTPGWVIDSAKEKAIWYTCKGVADGEYYGSNG